MKVSTVLAFIQAVAAVPVVPSYFRALQTTPVDIKSETVQVELGSSLSNTTTIFGPDSRNFANATKRWDTYAMPQVQVVVEPGEESDVSKIVNYCNENSIDFLVYNRGHGNPTSLTSFNGIQISIHNLNKMAIQPGNKSVWLGGGVYDGPVARYLWEHGYVTTTGAADCVGVAGAGLGGGHGRLQGLYGMVSDNFLQFNVVLADGSPVRVNSTSHPDLYWALRGAGHNFGIVTSMEMNIFERGPDTWFYKNYVWSGDKLDVVFKALNDLHGNGTTPTIMAVNYGSFVIVPALNATAPVISWQFAARGTEDEAAQYFTPFDAIESLSVESGNLPYPDIAHAQSVGENDTVCTASLDRLLTTAGLQVYNLTTEHQIYDSFVSRLASMPDLVSSTIIIHEGYATKAVQKIDAADSAYPFRADNILTQFQGNLLEGSDEEDEASMLEWAWEILDMWNAGQPHRLPSAYVNYANGLERVEDWYGHEQWRIDKLRAVKAQYDPDNKFRFYNPVV
ncbi:FAD-binding oxidoreductase [Aspergillus stella-maris]|uniref:FAD-binding oxidoreductase n=1 Tax=Aspergillus stella-maris TaxID=1810926 RepID=UPI003CCCABF4